MSRRRSEKKAEEGIPEWMATYGDMVTLLLTFFIMLFSMATIDKAKYEAVVNALRDQFTVQSSDISNDQAEGNSDIPGQGEGPVVTIKPTASPAATPTISTAPTATGVGGGAALAAEYDEFKKKMESLIIDFGLSEWITVLDGETAITLRINSIVLFDSGSADIKGAGREVLVKTGNFLRVLERPIVVQGHTDSVPIKSMLFPTNWELSTKRATNVVLFLIENSGLDPTKLTATGNGEFQPISPNDTEENRTKNRRIDVVIAK